MSNSYLFLYVEKPKDFKEDKKEAEKWGKKEEKKFEDKLNKQERNSVKDFVENKENILDKYPSLTFSFNPELNTYEKKTLEDMDKSMKKANLSESVITYKLVDAVNFGFNKELISGNTISSEGKEEFIKQFNNKDIIFDNYLMTHLTIQTTNSNERVLLKIKVPSSKGQSGETRAASINDKGEYKILIDNGYALHVDNITKTTIKGKECLRVEGSLKETLDFKNDINGKASVWGEKNYESWEKELSAEQRKDIYDYTDQGYKEINQYLREEKSGNVELEKKIDNISSALEKKPIPQNIVVYRWCSSVELGYKIGERPTLKDFENRLLGTVKETKEFMSTSLSSEYLSAFGKRNYILRLQVPKGYNGAYVGEIAKQKDEKEIILNKGSKYEINRVTKVVTTTTTNKGEKFVIDATLKK
nr:ADP-ribosyltransferase [Clostridium sp. Marseille-Q2269]